MAATTHHGTSVVNRVYPNQSELPVEFDFLIVNKNSTNDQGQCEAVGAHKPIMWARSEYFRKIVEEHAGAFAEHAQFSIIYTIDPQYPLDCFEILVKFLYSDRLNLPADEDKKTQFLAFAEIFAPDHIERLKRLSKKQVCKGHLNDHLLTLLDPSLPLATSLADVTFQLRDGKKFAGHKVVLASSSEYFKGMLLQGMKESKQTVVEFSEQEDHMVSLMKWIYGRKIDDETQKDVLGALALAMKYSEEVFRKRLEKLVIANLSSDNAEGLEVVRGFAEQLKNTAILDAIKRFSEKK